MAALAQENCCLGGSTKTVMKTMSANIQWQSIDAVFKTFLERLNNVGISDKDCIVMGKSIGDIPSTYKIPALQPHEKAVVGTFVDKHVVPGFRYRVRLNGTNDYLFDRRPMMLESIGQGYGKRLTFESDDILQNNNYFWSDSATLGYAFSIHVLSMDSRFEVHENGRRIGTCVVTSVADDQEIISSTNNLELMVHEKEVQVTFTCLFSLETEFLSEVVGLVTLVKGYRSERGLITDLHALLLPTGRRFLLRPLVGEGL